MSVKLSIYRVQFRPPPWLVKHTSLSCSQLLQLPILANCSSCPYLPTAPATKYMLWYGFFMESLTFVHPSEFLS
ncbi:unnamed protein product [Prunus armeniaca]